MATDPKITHWDKEVDVIVVGFGAAGGISAITAHEAGARVLLIEKMPHPGGISILSGGGVAFARNARMGMRRVRIPLVAATWSNCCPGRLVYPA